MDQKKILKAALGRIKKLALTSSAVRLKKKADAKKTPPAAKPPKEPEAEAPDFDLEADDAEEIESEEPEPKAETMTSLVFVGRGKKQPEKAPPMPPKKRGRPPKVKA